MDNFYEHHVLHSLAIATQFEFKKGRNNGSWLWWWFPGIPLAIFSETKFHLVDSINKKLKWPMKLHSLLGCKILLHNIPGQKILKTENLM